jgi:transposase
MLTPEDRAIVDRALEHIATLNGHVGNLRWLANHPYRSKSERVEPGQLALEFVAHLLGEAAAPCSTGGSVTSLPSSATKPLPRTKRKSNIQAISRQKLDRHLTEENLRCPCCGEVREPTSFIENPYLKYTPATVTLVTERVWQYACSQRCGDPAVAPATPKLIANSLCSSSLLSQLVISRVLDANPTERFGRQLARHGVELASSTLYDWFGRAGHEAELLLPHVQALLLGSDLVSLDDTPLLAKSREHLHGMQRGRLWLYVGDCDQVAFCQYSPDWKGAHPQRVLQGFTGHIQNDGYGGISPLFGPKASTVRVGCNDYARRRFVDAFKQGDHRVEAAVTIYNALYAVERELEARAGPEARLQLRRDKSTPLWENLHREVTALERFGERKTPLAKALRYWQNQNAALRAFLDNGLLPISNAHVERLLRTVALYRKNSLYIGSPEAGPRYAALLTLALNCTLCGANPYDYFCDLFDRLALNWPAKRIAELMPRRWLADRQASQQAAP